MAMQLQKVNVHNALNNTNTARWVPGYEGLYKITYNGMVYSYIKNKFLKPGLSQATGYLSVCLKTGDNRVTHTIHRLIGLAFLERTPDQIYINHIFGNKLQNHVEYLEWVTPGENNSHAIRTGLKRKAREPKGIIQMDMDGNEIARYHSSEHAPAQFSSGNICHVANGKRNQHGGYKWKFIN